MEVRTNHEVKAVTGQGVLVADPRSTEAAVLVEADSVVAAMGFRPNDQVYEEVKGSAEEVYNIGNSVRVSKILEVIAEASLWLNGFDRCERRGSGED